MAPRVWLTAMALTTLLGPFARQPASCSEKTLALVPRSSSLPSAYVGAGSCSASACHNANVAHGSSGSEFKIWASRDPHAKAYEALFDDRSLQIQKNLQRSIPAHRDPQCLRCHVAPEYEDVRASANASYFKTDGVSCENCHGPAKNWVNVHHLDGWRHNSAAEKKLLGMSDTRSLPGRAQLCASCHVGGQGMDVDHDLLAAGHPRLHFEFAAFHAHMPRHWPDAKDRAKPHFEARAWLVGQLAAAQAAFEVLGDRAGASARVWPEFAEFDCASCHHSLKATSPRLNFHVRRPGAFAWGHQVSLTPIAVRTFAKDGIGARMESLNQWMADPRKRGEVAVEARKAAAALKDMLESLDVDSIDVGRDLERVKTEILARSAHADAGSDAWTQIHLALAALSLSSKGLPPPAFHRFDPQAIHARLSFFKEP